MKTLQPYVTYNHWANELLLTLISKELSEEKIDIEIISSFSSLRKTVYHIWDAEDIWFKRLNGESPAVGISENFNGKFTEAKEKILSLDREFIEYVSTINFEKALETFTYKNIAGKEFTNPVWETIHHCMNHSTYHRGQIVTMLSQLGITNIPSTDFITYCRIEN